MARLRIQRVSVSNTAIITTLKVGIADDPILFVPNIIEQKETTGPSFDMGTAKIVTVLAAHEYS